MTIASLKKSSRRTRKIEFRVSDQEHERITKRVVHGLTLSAFVRILALGKPLPKRVGKPRSADPALVRELSRIGANMNQIARTLNTANLTGSPLNSLRILTALRQIEVQLQAVLRQEKGKKSTGEKDLC